MAEQPATLLWIGPTRHPEFSEIFRDCRRGVGQIAVRGSVRSATLRPSGHVRRVIFSRPFRWGPSARAWQAFAARYLESPDCETLALLGSLCDGEARTGMPWPGGSVPGPVGRTLRFSRWRELFPGWLGPCLSASADGLGIGPSGSDRPQAGTLTVGLPRGLLVLCDRYELAEPLLELGLTSGLPVAWQRRFLPALHAGFDTILWDDSIAPPATAEVWQERLQATSTELPAGLSRRHVWLAWQPSAEDLQQAYAAGITEVLTKPFPIDRVLPAGLSAGVTPPQVAAASDAGTESGRAAWSMKSVR
jgi:hypothetical protein